LNIVSRAVGRAGPWRYRQQPALLCCRTHRRPVLRIGQPGAAARPAGGWGDRVAADKSPDLRSRGRRPAAGAAAPRD